jgi:hypothetical protein
LVDSITDPNWNSYSFNSCRYYGKNRIVAFGSYDSAVSLASIVRSTDGGLHWEKPFRSSIVDSSWVGVVNDMAENNNDTTLAITDDLPRILMSTDEGKTWKSDLIRLDTVNFNVTGGFGLSWTTNGPIAIVGSGLNFITVKGVIVKSSVKSEIADNNILHLFPNPAMTEVHVHTNSGTGLTFSILDLLGREVRRKFSSDVNDVIFDLNGLKPGLYTVVSQSSAQIAKLIIVGK